MRHPIEPSSHLRGQVKRLGLPEPLPFAQTLLYRFFDHEDRLLYVGVTRRPYERWQAHKNSADWWGAVASFSFQAYPHERAALNAEVAAIRTEGPQHNKRSAHASLTDSSCAAHEESVQVSCATLPRVGVGVGEGCGVGVSEETIHVPHGRGQAKADGSLRSLRGGVLS